MTARPFCLSFVLFVLVSILPSFGQEGPESSCPVQLLKAELRPGRSEGHDDSPPTTSVLRLQFKNTSPRDIEELRIAVRPRLHAAGDLQRPTDVTPSPVRFSGRIASGKKKTVDAPVPVAPGLADIWLQEVRFADESQWFNHDASRCAYVPQESEGGL